MKKYKATHLDKAPFGKDSPYNGCAGRWSEETQKKISKLEAAQKKAGLFEDRSK
eukprot:SAG11_NODE_2701_length_3076_cov_5.049043_2_plen_54_part_00